MTHPEHDPQAVAADRQRAIDLFLHALSLLKPDTDGLGSGHDLTDLDAAAMLCHVVKGYTRAGHTPEDMLLYQLADATESLLVTAAVPATPDVVKPWHVARAEFLNCRLSAL